MRPKGVADGQQVEIPAPVCRPIGVTGKASVRPLMDWGRGTKAGAQANPRAAKGEVRQVKDDDVKPSRKASRVNLQTARTANRHRWVGRVY